jgi:hypothetical protein
MCDFENNFVLCTCAEGTLQNKEVGENIYCWRLHKGVATNSYEIGRYILPTSHIGKGLSNEFVLQHLNASPATCFDFDYTPNEGDYLEIFPFHERHFYLAFIFFQNAWKADHYSGYRFDHTRFKEGKVKPVTSKDA